MLGELGGWDLCSWQVEGRDVAGHPMAQGMALNHEEAHPNVRRAGAEKCSPCAPEMHTRLSVLPDLHACADVCVLIKWE